MQSQGAVSSVPQASASMAPHRSIDEVMKLERLGTLYPYPLSFMRCLVRRLMTENWSIHRIKFDLDENGFGEAVYEINSGERIFNFVVFSHYLSPEERSDRVIAEKWDMTATLCAGDLTEARLNRLRANVPLQEAGRVDPECIVLTRANKSGRNFNYVVDCLANGNQPDLSVIAKVGYLFRTTAVYGSGKFGMADWEKVCLRYPELARPFMAEMLACFLIRDFSVELTDWVAAQKNPKAIRLSDEIKRYFGIGNATGLGMAPYLINHPKLISNWIHVRELALDRICRLPTIEPGALQAFYEIAHKAIQHLDEIETDNIDQNALNETARRETSSVLEHLKHNPPGNWSEIILYAATQCECETQELINAILLEVHKDLVLALEEEFGSDETYVLQPNMTLQTLIKLIEEKYDWALAEDYSGEHCLDTFWYRSEEKMEPRLGRRSKEPGSEKEMFLGIGWKVKCLYDKLADQEDPSLSVARFLFAHPKFRYITRRVQTMAQSPCGEIRANLLDADVLPIQLLRCKLSFFGVGKFDPKSRLWVRNTMFQGAPLISDIGSEFRDDWFFPIKPQV